MPRETGLHSAIMTGWVRHRRRRQTTHAFGFPLCMLYLDLGEVEAVFGGRWLWSARRVAPIRYRRRDYLINDDPNEPLEQAVRRRVAEDAGTAPAGPVRVLTIPRSFGVSFNPVSFYYCFEDDGRSLAAMVAEITNTPWGERHAYVLPVAASQAASGPYRWRLNKRFHVSPFLPMDQTYLWTFSRPPGRPGEKLGVSMHNIDPDGARAFDATLGLRRRPLSAASRRRMLWAYPAMNLQALAAIYAHAGLLWLKRAPFHPHPKHQSTSVMEENR